MKFGVLIFSTSTANDYKHEWTSVKFIQFDNNGILICLEKARLVSTLCGF